MPAPKFDTSKWSTDQPVIIASNKLPVKIIKDPVSGKYSASWAGDQLIENPNSFSHEHVVSGTHVTFIGRPEIHIPLEDQKEVSTLLSQFDCHPIYIAPEEARLFYEGYCKSTLWPIFHNIVDVYRPVDLDVLAHPDDSTHPPAVHSTSVHQRECWNAFTRVNNAFAQMIGRVQHRTGALVWIHDYHLLLVPSYLARHLKAALNVGLFLHAPFPSSEVFRTLSRRKELLGGMLNADHIGFHLFEYARHFLSCCKRILGLSSQPSVRGQLGVDYGGRRIHITCSHMSVDVRGTDRLLRSPKMQHKIQELKSKFQHKEFKFAGCDSIERLKAIQAKVIAFDGFLERCPGYVSKSVLIQMGISCESRKLDYEQSKTELLSMIHRINKKYWTLSNESNVIEFIEVPQFGFKDRLAFWSVADIQVTTVVRDGLNTSPLEFIVAHRKNPGVVILSEFSGSSRLLTGVLTINPWELDQVIDAMLEAVEMSPEERSVREKCDLAFVASNPPNLWAKHILDDIVRAQRRDEEYQYLGTGFGLGFRVIEVAATFSKLSERQTSEGYRNSSRRILFFDYYRTLASNRSSPSSPPTSPSSNSASTSFSSTNNNKQNPSVLNEWPVVSPQVLLSLELLCRDRRNTVCIVSGCTRELLYARFGLVAGLTILAEHGYLKTRILPEETQSTIDGRKKEGVQWEIFCSGVSREYNKIDTQAWRARVEEIMRMYTTRTTGSAIEVKESSILFRFARTDFEFGLLQAIELKDHLETSLSGSPLVVLQGKDYIEVRPMGLNKGEVVKKLIRQHQEHDNRVDFVLCVGDDSADESMFETLEKLVEMNELDGNSIFSCTVGQKPSKARYYVDDETEVHALLKALRMVTTKSNRNFSFNDMTSLRAFTRHDHHPPQNHLHSNSSNSPNNKHRLMLIQQLSSSSSTRLRSLTTVMEEPNLNLNPGTLSSHNIPPVVLEADVQIHNSQEEERETQEPKWILPLSVSVMISSLWMLRRRRRRFRPFIKVLLSLLALTWISWYCHRRRLKGRHKRGKPPLEKITRQKSDTF